MVVLAEASPITAIIESVGDLCSLSIAEIKETHCVRKCNLQSKPIHSIEKVWIYEIKTLES